MQCAFPARLREAGLAPYWAFLGIAIAVFCLVQAAIQQINGFWIDEYFSIWVSQDATVGDMAYRIISDTNPPFYFTALAIVRTVIGDPRTAFVVLNLLCLLPTAWFTLATARRAGVLRTGLLALAAFLLSGPVFTYFPEGRTYFAGMCVAFAASWAAALVVVAGASRTTTTAFAVLAVLAALTHIFAGLYVGSLAGGLVGYGLLTRKRDLVVSGLVLGGIATLVVGVWFLTAPLTLSAVSWIVFDVRHVIEAAWFVRDVMVGPAVMVLPLLALVGYGLMLKATRPLVLVFGVAGALFVVLPIIVSLSTPIIAGRYWLIGAPALVVLMVWLARGFLMQVTRPGEIAAVGVVVFLAVTAAFGFVTSKRFTLEKPFWSGAEIVKEKAAGCGPDSIHVVSMGWPPSAIRTFTAGFPISTGMPATTFLDARQPGQASERVADMMCPVVGWGEHVSPSPLNAEMTDDRLLEWLNLEAAPGEVTILRKASGFVILKADTEPG